MAEQLNPYDYANIFNIYTDEEGLEFFNLYNTLNIDSDIDASLYIEHPANPYDTWYTLAAQYYNNVRLWWIILATNQIVNPFDDVPVGKKLKILKSDVVSDILTQINTGNEQ